MDTATILIGVAVFLICAAPVILFTNNDKKASSKLLKFISKEAGNLQYNVSETDQSGDFALAMDVNQKMLLFAKKLKYEYMIQNLALKDFNECKVIKSERISHNKNAHTDGIQKIELRFYYKEKTKSPLNIELFNAEENPSIQDELKVAEKWSVLINKLCNRSINSETQKVKEFELTQA